MLRYKNDGYAITIDLRKNNDYSVECKCLHDKNIDKFLVKIGILRKDILKVNYVGEQYISSEKEKIKENVCRMVEQMDNTGAFLDDINKYEYECRCFDIGNEMYEKIRMDDEKNDQ